VLAITGLITLMNRIISQAGVRGVQLGLGLQLIQQGLHLVRDTRSLWGLDSIGIGILGFALVLAFASSKRVPTALILFAAGLALAWPVTVSRASLRFGFNLPHWLCQLTWDDFSSSFFRAALRRFR